MSPNDVAWRPAKIETLTTGAILKSLPNGEEITLLSELTVKRTVDNVDRLTAAYEYDGVQVPSGQIEWKRGVTVYVRV